MSNQQSNISTHVDLAHCPHTGAYFHLSDSHDVNIEYLCKLSTDHRQIVVSHDHSPVNMKNILEVKTLHGEGGGGGGRGEEGGGGCVWGGCGCGYVCGWVCTCCGSGVYMQDCVSSKPFINNYMSTVCIWDLLLCYGIAHLLELYI